MLRSSATSTDSQEVKIYNTLNKETVAGWQMALQLFNYWKRGFMFFNLALYVTTPYSAGFGTSFFSSAFVVPLVGYYLYGRYATVSVNTHKEDNDYKKQNLHGFQAYGNPGIPFLTTFVSSAVASISLSKQLEYEGGVSPFLMTLIQGTAMQAFYLTFETALHRYSSTKGRSIFSSWAGTWHFNLEHKYISRSTYDAVEAAGVSLLFHQLFLALNCVNLVNNMWFLPAAFAVSWTLNNLLEHYSMCPRPMARLVPPQDWSAPHTVVALGTEVKEDAIVGLTAYPSEISKRIKFNTVLRIIASGLVVLTGSLPLKLTKVLDADQGATFSAKEYSIPAIWTILGLSALPILAERYARYKLHHRFFGGITASRDSRASYGPVNGNELSSVASTSTVVGAGAGVSATVPAPAARV